MHINGRNRWVRRGALATLLAAASAGSALAATPPSRVVARRVELTEADVAASNQKLSAAYAPLVTMWTTNFKQIGRRYVAPHLVRYRGAVRTGCGVMGSGNAGYCAANNAVFYDEVFVASQVKIAGQQLGTDGDMAGIGIIAHEVGHSVAIQLGEESRDSYANESTADCLAGAFALESQRDGLLEKGDLEEAFFGMAAAGDPTVELTGNPRIDNRIAARMSRVAHGTSEQRTSNFKSGYDSGPGACLPEFAKGPRG